MALGKYCFSTQIFHGCFFPTIFHSVFECCKLYVNLFLFIYPNVIQIVNLKSQARDLLLWLRLYSKHTNTHRDTHRAWLLLFAPFLCEHIRSVRADGKWKWTMRSTVSIRLAKKNIPPILESRPVLGFWGRKVEVLIAKSKKSDF